jgi:Holliday junction DNA helicase RuvB
MQLSGDSTNRDAYLRVLVGDQRDLRIVRVPAGGSFTVDVAGAVVPLDRTSQALLKEKGSMSTDFAAFAAQMGIRMSPKEDVVPAETTQAPRVVRPRSVTSMVGQDSLRLDLMAHVKGAQALGEQIGDVLLYGPSGLGKTSLAELIAHETGGTLHSIEAGAIDSPKTLIGELSKLAKGDVLFFDEAHGLTRRVERALLTIMETREVDMPVGSGSSKTTEKRRLPECTFVCATTDPGDLSDPFRNRFAFTAELQYYTVDELTEILLSAAAANRRHGEPAPIEIKEAAAFELAKRGRGTPRTAINHMHAVHRFLAAQAGDAEVVIEPDAVDYLSLKGIDEHGLTDADRRLILTIIKVYRGGPVGIERLAPSLGVSHRELRNVIEPYLIRTKRLMRADGGRIVTDEGYRCVGMDVPPTAPLASSITL